MMFDHRHSAGGDLNISNGSGFVDGQAAQWFTKLRSENCTSSDIEDHQIWLDFSPSHQIAYEELELIWKVTSGFAEKPLIKAAREQALSHRVGAEILQPVPSVTTKAVGNRPRWLPFAVAATLVLGLLGGGMGLQSVWLAKAQQGVYETAVGEQLSIHLDDGSVLLLDTQTKVRTLFTDQKRKVILSRGQARFDVAHDELRPFVVEAGKGLVTALGTAFLVRKTNERVLVTLIEGRVAVEKTSHGDDGAAAIVSAGDTVATLDGVHTDSLVGSTLPDSTQRLTLSPGQQLSYSDQGFTPVEQVKIERETAWQRGRLVFDDSALKDVIDDLNRYSERKILLADKSLEDIRITGVFKSGNNRKAVRALKKYFSMQVGSDKEGNLVLSARGDR